MSQWKNGIAKLTMPTPFPVGDVHSYLIKGDRLTLVDAGVRTKKAWEAFREQLAELRLQPEDIEQVILTHHHPDHVGLLDFLPAELEIYAHLHNERWLERTPEFIQHHDEFYSMLFRQFGIPDEYFVPAIGRMKKTLLFSCSPRRISMAIDEKTSIPGLDGWSIIETPGHAQGHITLYRQSDGVLIGGGTFLSKNLPKPLFGSPL
ncbi:MBL fold metallo-hydrolase, partial [Bacillus massilinigeriensis]|uniref:MBL fold metallo-hydrolase n=1 Tax=Bacillus mediterraneensis TaxID=1805474 RepID=UPI00114D459B